MKNMLYDKESKQKDLENRLNVDWNAKRIQINPDLEYYGGFELIENTRQEMAKSIVDIERNLLKNELIKRIHDPNVWDQLCDIELQLIQEIIDEEIKNIMAP